MDNQIEKQECATCRAIGMVLAAIIVGLITYYLLHTQALWVAIVVLLSLLIFGVFFVNWFCCRNVKATTAKVTPEAAQPTETAPVVTPEPVVKVAPEPVVAPTPEPVAAPVSAPEPVVEGDYDGDGKDEGADEGTQPEVLAGPRDGKADDLKKIKGVGPKLEKLLNSMGFYHFDQIANWTADETAWVDANLEGFKGRVSRDNWVSQSKTLAAGEETEFSKKVDKGGVY